MLLVLLKEERSGAAAEGIQNKRDGFSFRVFLHGTIGGDVINSRRNRSRRGRRDSHYRAAVSARPAACIDVDVWQEKKRRKKEKKIYTRFGQRFGSDQDAPVRSNLPVSCVLLTYLSDVIC